MHNIEYREYAENTPVREIIADVVSIVSRNGDGYGTDHLTFFDDVVCDNFSAAQEYIRSRDKDFYGGYAVRYYDFHNVKDSAKIEELRKKITETANKRNEFAKAHSVRSQKAAFIGCSVCGSKLNKDMLCTEKCPLCHEDLRSESTLARIEGYNKRIAEYRGKIEQERLKSKKQATVMWLVKFEWHS